MPITSVASAQLALIKMTATHGSSGAERSERSAMARTKNAMGTTTRFASNEIGVTRWKYHRINGSEQAQAASDTDAQWPSHSYPECSQRRGPRSKLRGRNGSTATQRCQNPKNGSANNTMAPTTAKES